MAFLYRISSNRTIYAKTGGKSSLMRIGKVDCACHCPYFYEAHINSVNFKRHILSCPNLMA